MSEINDENLVVALKSEILKRGYSIRAQEDAKFYAVEALLNSWKTIYTLGMRDQLEEIIWNYVDTDRMPVEAMIYKKINSSSIGKKSIIADYTNKNGKTHKAHYSHRIHKNCYLGSVSKLGNEPISFEMCERITRDVFRIHIDRLPNVKFISELFEVIEKKGKVVKVIIYDDDDDEEV
jgi:hypothetical protein